MCVKNLKEKRKKDRRANEGVIPFERKRETEGERKRKRGSPRGAVKQFRRNFFSGTLIVAEIYFRSPRIYLTS